MKTENKQLQQNASYALIKRQMDAYQKGTRYKIPNQTVEKMRVYKIDEKDKYTLTKTKKQIIAIILVASALAFGLSQIPNNEIEETDVGTIWNDPNGFSHFESVDQLENYCEEYNLELETIQYNTDSSGAVITSNTSLGKVKSKSSK